MNLEFMERKDFWAGMMLIVTGAVAIFIARNYAFGTSLRMGPGYFPIVLGGLLILFGLYVAAMSLRADAEKLNGPWLPRLLVVLPLMFVLFGITLNNHTYFYLAAIAIAIANVTTWFQRRRLRPALRARVRPASSPYTAVGAREGGDD